MLDLTPFWHSTIPIIIFWNVLKENLEIVPSKNIRMIYWKLHTSANIDLIDTIPRKTNTEVPTGLYILPNFKFWAVFGRRGCLNKSAKY